MRKTYKNKRDQYKAEAEIERSRANGLADQLKIMREQKEKEAAEKKKWWSCTVFCGNCLTVNNISCPPGMTIETGDCVHCRVRGHLKLVIDYPGKF